MVAACAAGCKKKDENERPIRRPAPADPFDTPAVAVEVSAGAARVWARVAGAAELEVAAADKATDGSETITRLAPVEPDADHTARIELTGLTPGARYVYKWRALDEVDKQVAGGTGGFVVPPAPETSAPLTFAFSGDLGGQNACRDVKRGYPILERLEAIEKLAFFIGLGDMIYADNPCRAKGAFGNDQIPGLQRKASTLEELRRNWRYNRSDPGLARLLARTGYFAVWDDHEIENNFGPVERGALFEVGLRVFHEHNPVPPKRLYRSVRWGKDLELFFLDLRSYRSPNTAADDDAKTMLGAEQKAWLLAALPASTALHKVVISSVPIAIPTGDETIGIDSWVGFETELAGVFKKLAESGVVALTFITTDVHFATAHRFEPPPELVGGKPLVINEVVVGPMSAGLFPTRALSPTFRPKRLFFHAPEGDPTRLTYDQSLRFMTVGIVEVSGASLAVRVENAAGETVWSSELGRPPE